MYMEMGCLVIAGQLKGMDTRLLIHYVEKGNMMVVMMTSRTYSPQQQALALFLF